MSSPKWPAVLGPDAERVLHEALVAVAERSFFADAQVCAGRRFDRIAGGVQRWLVAAIEFTREDCAGELRCTLSEELAVALFDAFTGREPLGPPRAPELLDLLGEFANMVCGSWLTRLAPGFSLGAPTVKWAAEGGRPIDADQPLLLTVNDLPMAVDVRAAARAAATV